MFLNRTIREDGRCKSLKCCNHVHVPSDCLVLVEGELCPFPDSGARSTNIFNCFFVVF